MQAWPDRSRPFLRSLLCATAAAFALAGCGGGDEGAPPPTPTPIVATADALTVVSGTTGNLLANDSFGGVPVTTGASGNVAFTLTTTAPTGVAVADGVVAVGPTAAPGVVTLNYTICQAGNAANCASAVSTVTIPAPAIVANADTFPLAIGGSGDLLANDTLGGASATASIWSPANVSVSVVTALPVGVTVSGAGLVTVAAPAAGSTSTITYRICQKAAPTNCANGTATVIALGSGAISGKAVDSSTGAGIAGVRVAVREGPSTTTDVTGSYVLHGAISSARAELRFTKADYADTTRITAVSSTGNTDVQARLVRVAARTTIPIETGGTALVADSPALLAIAPRSLQRVDIPLLSGNIIVSLTPISPAVDSAQMPGDFTERLLSDQGVSTVRPIESFGALGVKVEDSVGSTLELLAGHSAPIRIPLATRHPNPPATVQLFWLNGGLWVQEGTATLGGSGSARYYKGSISDRYLSATTWTAGMFYDPVNLTGCVADAAGARIANATVVSDGVDYSGTTSTTTDASGNFTLPLKRSSSAAVTGISNGRHTNTVRVDTSTVDRTMATCLALGHAGAGITMKLTWGEQPSDLDAHLYLPNGREISFGNQGTLTGTPFASVDVDDVNSYGPEVMTISRLMVGTYRYSVNNFSGPSSGNFRSSNARVELNVPGRALELITPPATGESATTDWWNLFEFDVDFDCTVTIRRIGAFGNSPPKRSESGGVYCTPP